MNVFLVQKPPRRLNTAPKTEMLWSWVLCHVRGVSLGGTKSLFVLSKSRWRWIGQFLLCWLTVYWKGQLRVPPIVTLPT